MMISSGKIYLIFIICNYPEILEPPNRLICSTTENTTIHQLHISDFSLRRSKVPIPYKA